MLKTVPRDPGAPTSARGGEQLSPRPRCDTSSAASRKHTAAVAGSKAAMLRTHRWSVKPANGPPRTPEELGRARVQRGWQGVRPRGSASLAVAGPPVACQATALTHLSQEQHRFDLSHSVCDRPNSHFAVKHVLHRQRGNSGSACRRPEGPPRPPEAGPGRHPAPPSLLALFGHICPTHGLPALHSPSAADGSGARLPVGCWAETQARHRAAGFPAAGGGAWGRPLLRAAEGGPAPALCFPPPSWGFAEQRTAGGRSSK